MNEYLKMRSVPIFWWTRPIIVVTTMRALVCFRNGGEAVLSPIGLITITKVSERNHH